MENHKSDELNLEEQIANMIKNLYKNPELDKFFMSLKNATQNLQFERCIPRVKSISSAQRTAKIKKFKSLEDANDYIGIAFIVNDTDQIFNIAKRLEEIYSNCVSMNFVNEETVYSPLCYVKKVPPLMYSIVTRQDIGTQKNIPIEIRICTKESYISNQSIHDTVYKNDNLNISLDEKIKLLCLSQHLAYKLAVLSNPEKLTEEQRQKHEKELKRVLEDNKSFLGKHAKTLEKVIIEYGTATYEYEHKEEFGQRETNKTKLLDNVRKIYSRLYKNCTITGANFVERANQPIRKIYRRFWLR